MFYIVSAFILMFNNNIINNPQFLPISSGEQIFHHYYILSYNENIEQANWVYYELKPEMLDGKFKRTNSFRLDQMISSKSANTNDYTNTGFDRGHLCPAADMNFDSIAMYESFYMSNVSPQVPEFNRGIWKSLEEQVRNWVLKKGKIIVVTGPIIKNFNHKIGKNEVVVPNQFFKVLYSEDLNQIIAFDLLNSPSNLSLVDFAITVDSLEQITGFDFFSQLPDSIENELESKVKLDGWFESSIAHNEFQLKRNQSSLFIIIFASSVFLVVAVYKFVKRL